MVTAITRADYPVSLAKVEEALADYEIEVDTYALLRTVQWLYRRLALETGQVVG